MGVLRAPSSLASRRSALALAAGTAIVCAASLAATAAPEGCNRGRCPGVRDGGTGPRMDPLLWVDYSRRSFQGLMRLLAARSAMVPRPDEPGPPLPQPRRGEPDRGPPPPGFEPAPAQWPNHHEPDDGEDRARRQPAGESGRCPRAGAAVEGAGWYVVQGGDTLWHIALAHYGNGRAWRRILDANRRTIPDPDRINACQRLYIPRWGISRPPPEEAWEPPERRHRPVVPVHLGPDGCSRCGGGRHHSPGREWQQGD
jgi:hypothetical protein